MKHSINTVKGAVRFDDEDFYVVVFEATKTTRIVTCQPAMDGGMVAFSDAVTGEQAGCCGIHWFPLNAVKLGDFYFQGRPPIKPPWPPHDPR